MKVKIELNHEVNFLVFPTKLRMSPCRNFKLTFIFKAINNNITVLDLIIKKKDEIKCRIVIDFGRSPGIRG